jgi:hypothetical protein
MSPALKLSSLSSAASKSYRALTLVSCGGGEDGLTGELLIEGYSEELLMAPPLLLDFDLPDSFRDSSIARER